jgi:hypothetical protein
MVDIRERSIFKLKVPSITSKALLVGIFHEVESLVLHTHPKNIIKLYFSLQIFYVSMSGHNMGTMLIVVLE